MAYFLAAVSNMSPGIHMHKCPACTFTWAHADLNHGNQQAHTCPNCGTGPIWNRFHGEGEPAHA